MLQGEPYQRMWHRRVITITFFHISSDESGMVRKPSSNAWFGETFAIECNWGGLCVFTLDQCCRKSHWKSLVGESDLGVIAWCITASLHISDFSSCMCLCHLYSSYPALFPACFCCTVVLWLQSDTCLDPMSNADASGNARGAETSDRPTLGGTADPLGNPIVGGNPNPSGSGDGNNDTKAPLCPLPSSMRNELFQDLFCFCVTLLRAFSLAAELRPCATRTDSSERAEREVQEATRVMEDRELYRTFLVLKEGLTSDPEKRREIEKTTHTKGRDRSRSRQRWFGHVNERATMVIHRNCHSSILWPFGVFLNVQLELCPDLYVSEKRLYVICIDHIHFAQSFFLFQLHNSSVKPHQFDCAIFILIYCWRFWYCYSKCIYKALPGRPFPWRRISVGSWAGLILMSYWPHSLIHIHHETQKHEIEKPKFSEL